MEEPATYLGQPIPQPRPCLNRTEQLELLLWHPLFTGKCPQCGQDFPQNTQSLTQWICNRCNWQTSI